jgi:hypothetical protein
VNGEGSLDDGKKLNAVLQSEYNHVVCQPRLRDDVRTYSGDVSQILVDGLCVVGRKEWLQ